MTESSSLRQAGNSIEVLALNEIVKEFLNSECDEQKHPTDQKNPRDKKMSCPGHHYEQVQVSTNHDHCLILQRQLNEAASGVKSKN